MEEIYDTNDSFQFDKLVLTKPTLVAGGNYFIRCLINGTPLYIQPPKCTTKQGIQKSGKRFYTDLMFINENEQFISWMEKLENHCQQYIFNNREKWFDGEMDLSDIENYFTSPLKIYKSGKFYIARANVSSILGKPTLKIYDENETEINFESINDKTNLMTILEIQGIKCSARSFQIDLEIKQIMVLNPVNRFEKCIIKSAVSATATKEIHNGVMSGTSADEFEMVKRDEPNNNNNNIEFTLENAVNNNDAEYSPSIPHVTLLPLSDSLSMDPIMNINAEDILKPSKEIPNNLGNDGQTPSTTSTEFSRLPTTYGNGGSGSLQDIDSKELDFINENKNGDNQLVNNSELHDGQVVPSVSVSVGQQLSPVLSKEFEMEEIEFHLEELPENDFIQLKKRNDVYFEMYKEARKKAKIARDLALTSYLEAKRIKNTYLLDYNDGDDESDESDEGDLEDLAANK